MSATTTNNYKTTFILDLRESEDDSAKLLADLTEILASLGGTVTDSEDLGVREFARAADRRFTQGHILEVYFDGPAHSACATPREASSRQARQSHLRSVGLI